MDEPLQTPADDAWDDDELTSLEVIRQRYVVYVLNLCGGNCNAAARILGLNRKTLYRRLTRWGVERRRYRSA